MTFETRQSGSIEGNSPTSVGPNLIAALSSSDTNSVGTWKLIKGKVSQTIEDIKSSKSSNNQTTPTTITKGESNEPDSDQENSLISNPPTSACDELTLDQELKLLQNKDVDTDSDAEFELIYEGDSHSERSRLRRGFANLKSKVKAKSTAHQQLPQPTNPSLSSSTLSINTTATAAKPFKKDTSPSRSEGSGSTSSLRATFLRKRRKDPVETGELVSPSTIMSSKAPVKTASSTAVAGAAKKEKGIIAGKKDIEIESGVEMLEDMVPPTTQAGNTSVDAKMPPQDEQRHNRDEMKLPLKSKENQGVQINTPTKDMKIRSTNCKDLESNKFNTSSVIGSVSFGFLKRIFRRLPHVTLLALLVIMIMPLNEFFRGAIAAFLLMALLDAMWCHIQDFIEHMITNAEPERTTFQVPDYSKMSIFEVPAAEEHKTIKSYSVSLPPHFTRCFENSRMVFRCDQNDPLQRHDIKGDNFETQIKFSHHKNRGWLNEVNSYDPANFHISMTKSVYVKLEGTTLRLSSTNARIPKRIMWNEPPIDRKTIQFTDHRTFNLLGARIEMLPLGLARKRYFNRKYPMQLIIKNCESKAGTANTANTETPGNSETLLDTKCLTTSENIKESTTNTDSVGKFGDRKESSKFFDVRDSSSGGSLSNSNLLITAQSGGSKMQHPNDATEEHPTAEADSELDFAATIINADLQTLHFTANPDADLNEIPSVPCGDETRLLLFTRGDREKEDWYRRFLAASTGEVNDQELRFPNMRLIDDNDLQAAAVKTALLLTGGGPSMNKTDGISNSNPNTNVSSAPNTISDDSKTQNPTPKGSESSIPIAAEVKADKATIISSTTTSIQSTIKATPDKEINDDFEQDFTTVFDETFEGLIMSSCAARNPPDYIRFMTLYQNACNQTHIPVYKKVDHKMSSDKRQRRIKRLENELWKGIDQSLFLGPSGSVVWANVLAGRLIYSVLHDTIMQNKIKDFLQKKLSSIKLPSFMEEVTITQIDLGNTPPLIHRISQPMLDERGTWVDADVTYEGLLYITVTTRMNLMRLKRQSRHVAANMHLGADTPGTGTPTATNLPPINIISDEMSQNSINPVHDEQTIEDHSSGSAIYDSDAESSGHSSSDSDSTIPGAPEAAASNAEFNVFNTSPGNARRIFRIVDRFAASNFFQYATELSYVQRAMENMRSNITLRVELKGLVARGTLNIPPPPSDRVWLAFRGPPRLWISAKPAFGEKSVDWSIVTNVIENKLCEEVNKFLVYPNMVDVMIPLLGQSTYTEHE